MEATCKQLDAIVIGTDRRLTMAASCHHSTDLSCLQQLIILYTSGMSGIHWLTSEKQILVQCVIYACHVSLWEECGPMFFYRFNSWVSHVCKRKTSAGKINNSPPCVRWMGNMRGFGKEQRQKFKARDPRRTPEQHVKVRRHRSRSGTCEDVKNKVAMWDVCLSSLGLCFDT